jgi:hypothetical protein
MQIHQYRHLLLFLLGSCFLFLFTACGSNTSASSATTARPTTTAVARVPPTTVLAQTPKLIITFGCNGARKEGFYADQSHAFACVHTLPGAALTISVSYCNGDLDQSSDLKGTFMADRTGFYEWDWKPKARCSNGPAFWSGKASVIARLVGQTVTGFYTYQAD